LKRTVGRVLMATYLPASFFTLIWLLVPEWLCRIYTSDPELIRMSSDYLRMAAIANLFQVLEMVLQEGMTGAGNSSAALRITLPGNLLRIPLALALVAWTDWGINGVWAAILISSIVKGGGMALLFLKGSWMKDLEGRARSAARQAA
jgi:Na+-driven multidrug efflux pump